MNLFNNKLTIHRSDGTIIEDVSASVQKKIYIKDNTVPVEAGDTISQLLPSGLTKEMLVTEVRVHDTGSDLDHTVVEYTTV